jgi:solute carrier family 35 protein
MRFRSAWAVVGYGTCSSLMLVINKLAVSFLPAPSFLLLVQCLASWVAVWLAGRCGCATVDRLEWSKLRAFLPVSAAFLACIFANMKTLQYLNVDTFIVFRASTPLVIALCDYAFLGRQLPGMRSAACLVALLLGALGYVYSDAGFAVHGYAWVALWYCVFCFDQARARRLGRARLLGRALSWPRTPHQSGAWLASHGSDRPRQPTDTLLAGCLCS